MTKGKWGVPGSCQKNCKRAVKGDPKANFAQAEQSRLNLTPQLRIRTSDASGVVGRK
jgi:hypothetical protein